MQAKHYSYKHIVLKIIPTQVDDGVHITSIMTMIMTDANCTIRYNHSDQSNHDYYYYLIHTQTQTQTLKARIHQNLQGHQLA